MKKTHRELKKEGWGWSFFFPGIPWHGSHKKLYWGANRRVAFYLGDSPFRLHVSAPSTEAIIASAQYEAGMIMHVCSNWNRWSPPTSIAEVPTISHCLSHGHKMRKSILGLWGWGSQDGEGDTRGLEKWYRVFLYFDRPCV